MPVCRYVDARGRQREGKRCRRSCLPHDCMQGEAHAPVDEAADRARPSSLAATTAALLLLLSGGGSDEARAAVVPIGLNSASVQGQAGDKPRDLCLSVGGGVGMGGRPMAGPQQDPTDVPARGSRRGRPGRPPGRTAVAPGCSSRRPQRRLLGGGAVGEELHLLCLHI